MTEKLHKSRKVNKSELNRIRDLDIDTKADITLDTRDKKYEGKEKNRYNQKLEQRKLEKAKKANAKLEKFYIRNKKHIEKRAIVEAELQQS